MPAASQSLAASDAADKFPREVVLEQNYPNPFNPTTQIRFALPSADHVELAIYDVKGRLVRTLASRTFGAGGHVVDWDGKDRSGNGVASGIYLYELRSSSVTLTKKMTLLQ
jgi:flagellar hook assembly protein FlgD